MTMFCTSCGGTVQNDVCTVCKKRVADESSWAILNGPTPVQRIAGEPQSLPGYPGAGLLSEPQASPGYAGAGLPGGEPGSGFPGSGAPGDFSGSLADPGPRTPLLGDPPSGSQSAVPNPSAPGYDTMAMPPGYPALPAPYGAPGSPGVGYPAAPGSAAYQPAPPPPLSPRPAPRRRRSHRGLIAAVVVLVVGVAAGGYFLFLKKPDSAATPSTTTTATPKPVAPSTTRQTVGGIRLSVPAKFVAIKGPASPKYFGNASTVAKATELVTVSITKLAGAQPVAKYNAAAKAKLAAVWKATVLKQAAAKGKDCQGSKITATTNVGKKGYFGTDFTLTCTNRSRAGVQVRDRFLVVGDGNTSQVTVFATSALWTKDKALLTPIIASVVPKG